MEAQLHTAITIPQGEHDSSKTLLAQTPGNKDGSNTALVEAKHTVGCMACASSLRVTVLQLFSIWDMQAARGSWERVAGGAAVEVADITRTNRHEDMRRMGRPGQNTCKVLVAPYGHLGRCLVWLGDLGCRRNSRSKG